MLPHADHAARRLRTAHPWHWGGGRGWSRVGDRGDRGQQAVLPRCGRRLRVEQADRCTSGWTHDGVRGRRGRHHHHHLERRLWMDGRNSWTVLGRHSRYPRRRALPCVWVGVERPRVFSKLSTFQRTLSRALPSLRGSQLARVGVLQLYCCPCTAYAFLEIQSVRDNQGDCRFIQGDTFDASPRRCRSRARRTAVTLTRP